MLSTPVKKSQCVVFDEEMSTPKDELQITPINKMMNPNTNGHIEGLVITKSEVKKFEDGRTELFTFTIRDKTGEIEVTVFNSHPSFYKIYYDIFLNKCYKITNCVIQPANDEFNMTRNDFQLHFTESSTVDIINDHLEHIPFFEYPYEAISQVQHQEDEAASVLGVCVNHSALIFNTDRHGRPITLREIWLLDQSNMQIKVTLWENEARKFDTSSLNPIIYVYGARVREFRDTYHLSTVMNTMILVNPNTREAHELRTWFMTTRPQA